MKGATVVCFLVLAAVALARPNEEKEMYTDRYDSLNLPEILENKTLLDSYTSCMLDKGRCTADAKELKSHMKEAIETDCEKCTKAQREGTRTVIAHLINHEEGTWNALKTKYDPSGKHSARYEKELKELKH